MSKPLVAVVGRPNVGKSTFFNKICRTRASITLNYRGVTRDRVYADTDWCGYAFTLIDTGGLEIDSTDVMWSSIRKQTEIAIEIADAVLFIVDGKEGIMPDDYKIADILRRSGKPIILCANKLDNPFETAYEFYELGLGEVFCMSAEHMKGMGDILDELVSHLKKIPEEENKERIKVAVVGKPNAGKSSIVNKLLGFERTIVSDIAGTTRDAIDTPITYNDKEYLLIDTAGLRKKKNVEEDVEYYSVMRSLGAIRRADVVLLVVDASAGELSEQDVRIAGYIHEQGKPSIVVMNKWDIIEKDTYTINTFKTKLTEQLKFMDYFVSQYVSALTGKRVIKLFDEVDRVLENSKRRITTGVLNEVVLDAVATNEPPMHNGRRLKILYASEVSVCPPTFIVFTNDAKLVHFSYSRYLQNCIRKAFDFTGTPIKMIFKNKSDE